MTKTVDNKKVLARISKSIAKIGKQMAEQSLEVGRLLQEARALHETAGKFLGWAESEQLEEYRKLEESLG